MSLYRGDSSRDAFELADDDAPNLQRIAAAQLERGIGRVGGQQGDFAAAAVQALDQTLAIDEGDHDVTVCGLDAAIDHQDVAVVDVGVLHRITAHGEEEGQDGVAHQVIVDVEAPVGVVLGRGGEKPADTGVMPSGISTGSGSSAAQGRSG